jgi:Bacterial Ig-like domain (group 2)
MKLCRVCLLFLAVLSVIGAAACGSSSQRTGSATLQVIASQTAMQAGATQQLKAIVRNANGSTTDVTAKATWSSAYDGVASVGTSGLVTGTGPGSTLITATYQQASSSTEIEVTKLFGVSSCCPNQFLLLTTSLGQFSIVHSIGDELSGFFGSAADPEHHRFYVPRLDTTNNVWSLLTLDTQTGDLISTQTLSVPGGFDWQWDAVSQRLLLITTLSSDNSRNDFVAVDPASLVVTPILQVGDSSVSFNSASSFDSKAGVFYFLRFSSSNEPTLLGVNVSSGGIQSQFPITSPAPFVMQWDASSGLLYGLEGNNFVSIDPTTGRIQVKGTVGEASTAFDSFLSAIDSVRRRFYVVEVLTAPGSANTEQIVGIDLDTGSVAETLMLNNPIILLGAEQGAQ